MTELLANDGIIIPASKGRGSFSSDSLKLYWEASSPENSIASVVLVHGIGEHCSRYSQLVDTLNANGIAVYGFDLRGHGRSEGVRGHIDTWQDYIDDLRTFVDFVQGLEGDQPTFVLGHSMGALIALDFAIQYPTKINGLLINGIPLRPGSVAKPYLILLAKLIALVKPSHLMQLDIDASGISSDAAVVKAYQADPLVQTKVSAQWGVSIIGAIGRLRGAAQSLDVPVLMTHGRLDPINLPVGTTELFATVVVRDKSIQLYEHSRHEVHNDRDQVQFGADVSDWILPRTRPLGV